MCVRIGGQLGGRSGLDYTAVTQHDDQVTPAYRAQSVGDDEDGTVSQAPLNDVVDDSVCFRVDGRCCLVHYQYPASSEKGTRQTEQLFLAATETVNGDWRVEPLWQTQHELLQLCRLQSRPNLVVGGRVARIEVVADGAGEEDGVLRYDGQAGPESGERNTGNVDTIEEDLTGTDADSREQAHRQRSLAATGPTTYADLTQAS